MNTFFKQFKQEADRIRLTDAERSLMLSRLESAMKGNSSPIQVTPSPYFSFVMPRMLVPTLALVLIVVGGGATFAAEGALPGDLLYPIKVSVNESLRTSLAFSEESQVELHAAFAERRLEEATALAASGKLTPIAKAGLEENFEAHAEKVSAIVASVEGKDPVAAADISARFESKVAARGAVIASIGRTSADATTKAESGKIASNVAKRGSSGGGAVAMQMNMMMAESADAAADTSVRSFAKGTLAPPQPEGGERDTDSFVAERLGGSVLDILADAEVRLNAISKTLGATTTARVQLQITSIRDSLDKMRAEGDTATVRRSVEQALRDAAKLRAFLEAQQKFHTLILPTSIETAIEGEVILNIGNDPVEEKLPL